MTPYEEWIGRKSSLSYLRTWDFLAKDNMPINKNRKLCNKIVYSVFLEYAHYIIAYRYLMIKSEVYVHVDTFL
jgi:hypothetical protein